MFISSFKKCDQPPFPTPPPQTHTSQVLYINHNNTHSIISRPLKEVSLESPQVNPSPPDSMHSMHVPISEPRVLPELHRITTPLKLLAAYLLQGIQHGFRIGFDRHYKCKSTKRNMPSAYQHPSIVESYLAKERNTCRIIGPLNPQSLPHEKVSPFGVIPKRRPTRQMAPDSQPFFSRWLQHE